MIMKRYWLKIGAPVVLAGLAISLIASYEEKPEKLRVGAVRGKP
jgi:hypothetical protein